MNNIETTSLSTIVKLVSMLAIDTSAVLFVCQQHFLRFLAQCQMAARRCSNRIALDDDDDDDGRGNTNDNNNNDDSDGDDASNQQRDAGFDAATRLMTFAIQTIDVTHARRLILVFAEQFAKRCNA